MVPGTPEPPGTGVTAIETAARRRNPASLLTVRRALVLLLVMGAAARAVRYGLAFPLWGDEAFVAVNFLHRGFRDMIDPLLYGQIAPLGYMWATLLAVRTLGLSEWAIRLVPFAAGVAGLVLLWRLAAAEFGRRATVCAVGFLAAAYYPIRHAAEVKPYSTDLLVSLVLWLLAFAVRRRPTDTARWIALILAGAASVWLSYPAAFVAGGIGLYLTCVLRTRRAFPVVAGWLLYGLLLCGSFAAMYALYARPHAEAAARVAEISMWTETYPPVREPWLLPLWFLETHTGNMLAYPVGGKNGGSTATFLLVAAGVVALWKTRRYDLVLLLLSPLMLNFIASSFHKYPYGGTVRVMMYMAPAFCLLAGLGLTLVMRRVGGLVRDRIPFAYNRHAVPVTGAVFAAIPAALILRDVAVPFKKDANYESRRTVAWLAGQVAAGDDVVVFNAMDDKRPYAPFIAPWRGDGAQFIYYMTRDIPVGVRWAPPPEDVRPVGGRTWFVVYSGHEFREKHDLYRTEVDRQYGDTHPPFDAMLAAYLGILEKNLGPARRHAFPLQTRRGIEGYQQIDVYEFGPPNAATTPRA